MNWPHKSHEDLLLAGYLHRGRVPCPLCGCQVEIYQQLNQFPMFLDPETLQVHIAVSQHADPPFAFIDRKSAASGERVEK